jgi:hypothetical protein
MARPHVFQCRRCGIVAFSKVSPLVLDFDRQVAFRSRQSEFPFGSLSFSLSPSALAAAAEKAAAEKAGSLSLPSPPDKGRSLWHQQDGITSRAPRESGLEAYAVRFAMSAARRAWRFGQGRLSFGCRCLLRVIQCVGGVIHLGTLTCLSGARSFDFDFVSPCWATRGE